MTDSLTFPFGPSRRRSLHFVPLHAVWISLGVIVIWALWAAAFNTAQFGDNIEQFNWAQSLELGYHKHPPLPSWALGLVVRLFGPSIYWAYVLSTACLLGTASFTWLIGRRLVGERVAAAAVVLWGLSLSFSQRVQLYNHNTVLVFWMAATVWLALRATAAPRRTHLLWWAATGVAAAAAVLSKYQALVPLAGLLFALVMSGSLPRREDRGGIGVAAVVMLLACAPHAVWVAHHDFCTLRYASDAVEASTFLQRCAFILSFVANQLRICSPALLAIAVCAGLARFRPPPALSDEWSPNPASGSIRVWMFGLLGAGLVVLAVMALVAGVSLRNHWGVQALQFLPIWLALRWDRRTPIDLRRLVGVALAIHAAGLVGYGVEHNDLSAVSSSRRIDTMYPARRLAQVAVKHWTASTSCALHYVAGTVFDSGLVSLYSGGNLVVFDTALATPWVRLDDLRREGALYVLDGDDPVPAGVTQVMTFELVPGDRVGRVARRVRIGILQPRMPCGD